MPKEARCGSDCGNGSCRCSPLGVLAASLPAVVLVLLGDVTVSLTGEVHFYSVGFSAFAAAAAAFGLTVVGARRSDTRTVLVGTAFAVMASLLALHGFSTPGVWFGNNGVVAITGGATLPAGAVILDALDLPAAARPPEHARAARSARRAARAS